MELEQTTVIVGLGALGFRICEQLMSLGKPILVLEQEKNHFVAAVQRYEVPVRIGNLHDPWFLRQANIQQAESIIIATGSEELNLEVALLTRDIAPSTPIVIRQFNQELGSKIARDVPHTDVLSLSALAGETFALGTLDSRILRTFNWNKILYALAVISPDEWLELQKNAHCRLVCIKVGENWNFDANISNADRLLVILPAQALIAQGQSAINPWERFWSQYCSLHRRKWFNFSRRVDRFVIYTLFVLMLFLVIGTTFFAFFHPENLSSLDALYFVATMVTTVGFGDIQLRAAAPPVKIIGILFMFSGMILMATIVGIVTEILLSARHEELQGRRHYFWRGHTILCGLGNVGFRILEALLASGQRVIVIEKNPKPLFLALAQEMNVPVITADATLVQSLNFANIREAKALIAATNQDMVNLEVGLNARELNPDARVTLRIFYPHIARLMERYFDIHCIFSSADLAAPTFATLGLRELILAQLPLNGRSLDILTESPGKVMSLGDFIAQHPGSRFLALNKRESMILEPLSMDREISPQDQVLFASLRAPIIRLEVTLPSL